jgi:hypothetical protein
MTKYRISFSASAMDILQEDWAAVEEAAGAVIREAKVAGDGTVTHETYTQTQDFNGGFCVLELSSSEAAHVKGSTG